MGVLKFHTESLPLVAKAERTQNKVKACFWPSFPVRKEKRADNTSTGRQRRGRGSSCSLRTRLFLRPPWGSQVTPWYRLPASVDDAGSIPGWRRSPGEGNGNPLQYSCLENPMDRGAWWAAVDRVTKSQTRLKQLSMHAAKGNREKKEERR